MQRGSISITVSEAGAASSTARVNPPGPGPDFADVAAGKRRQPLPV